MTRLTQLTTAAVLLCGLGAAAAVVAQDQPQPMPMDGPMGGMHHRGPAIDFKTIDTDGDGTLTKTELTAHAAARLGTLDANRDGALDRAELITSMPAPRDNLMMVFAPDPSEERADRLLAFMDATDSGRVEIVALTERQVNGVLAWLDKNSDDAITLAEAQAGAKHGPRHGPGRANWHEHRGDGPDEQRG